MNKELSKDAKNASSANLTAVDFLIQEIKNDQFVKSKSTKEWNEIFDKAKEMEKEQHEKFNKFLNDEIKLSISDENTIKRIQWYYNTYFNETYGGNK